MDYLKLVDQYRDEMIATLVDLIKIRSVEEEGVETPDKGYLPFGHGVQEALEFMLELGKKEGFDVLNVDNYGGHIDFDGDGSSDEIMAIIGHLDVVPEGDDWTYDPYGGTIIDDVMYSRGASDDKGPVIASFYAMKILKDAGFVPAKKIRLILGLDEETNWYGMDHYFSKVEKPTFGFTPDSGFPPTHGEMGILVFDFIKKFAPCEKEGLILKSVKGGNAANMVPDRAKAVICGDAAAYEEVAAKVASYVDETNYKVSTAVVDGELEISVEGISAHGGWPKSGLNAVSIVMEVLGKIEFVNEGADFVKFYNDHIGFALDGSKIGCGLYDEPSGNLVWNVGVLDMDLETATLTVNARYPVTNTSEDVYGGFAEILKQNGIEVVEQSHKKPIYRPIDDPFIVTLMDVYREHTGDMESQPSVMAGGTYARACEGIVAFGAEYPGENGFAHKRDERIDLNNLMRTVKIFVDVIYRLTKDA